MALPLFLEKDLNTNSYFQNPNSGSRQKEGHNGKKIAFIHNSKVVLLFFVSFSLLFDCIHCTQLEGSVLWLYVEEGFPGASFHWSEGSSPGDPCTSHFQHIVCDDSGTYVTWLNLDGLGLKGSLVPELSQLTKLERIWVQNNQITGEIPASLGSLENLEWLDLSHNNFSGEIPNSLASLSKLVKLNFSYNNLSGSIPKELWSFCSLGAFDGNPLLDISPCNKKHVSTKPPFFPFVVVFFVLFVFFIFFAFRCSLRKEKEKEKEKKRKKEKFEIEGGLLMSSTTFRTSGTYEHGRLKKFPLSEISEATSNFKKENIISETPNVSIYKAVFPDGKIGAVNCLKGHFQNLSIEEFLSKVEKIGQALHGNLLPLEGFCTEGGERCLVFPFLSLRSVEDHFPGGPLPPLSLSSRSLLAQDVAEALSYLHFSLDPPQFHSNINAGTVLLDSNFRAILSDFGLSTEKNKEGTFSEKTDVYCFGIFLIELVFGKPISQIEFSGGENATIQNKLTNLLKNDEFQKSMGLSDLSKETKYNLIKILHVSNLCLHEKPENRPSMKEICFKLKEENLREHWGRWKSQDAVSLTIPDYSETLLLPGGSKFTEEVNLGIPFWKKKKKGFLGFLGFFGFFGFLGFF